MAFFGKVRSILRREISASKPSIYQAIRCMSSSKLFIGARVIRDHETGRSRGFGFVTYNSEKEASSAIQSLDGQDLHGRRVRVNYAADKARRGGFGGFNSINYGEAGGCRVYGESHGIRWFRNRYGAVGFFNG